MSVSLLKYQINFVQVVKSGELLQKSYDIYELLIDLYV